MESQFTQVTNLTLCGKTCNIFVGFGNIFNEIKLMSLFWFFVYFRIPIVTMYFLINCMVCSTCKFHTLYASFFSEKLPFLKLSVS